MKMPLHHSDLMLLGLGIVAVAVLFPKIPGAIARQVPNVVGETAGGIVIGTGEAVGIPATDASTCAADVAAGKTWDASFDCTAPNFFRYLFGIPLK